MSGFRDAAPQSGELLEPFSTETGEQESTLLPERGAKLARYIFPMAILAAGNNLTTEEYRFVQLFQAMQSGEIPFPSAMQPVVEDVVIQSEAYPYSREVHSMLFNACLCLGITWQNVQPNESIPFVRQFNVPQEVAEQLAAKWGEDQEAMEFFGQCADFLRLKK
jgi:hypothetical protein